jgi:hypothetical protein
MRYGLWLLLCLLTWPLLAAENSLRVQASGEGSGGSSLSRDQVRQLALSDAKRAALEQAGTAVLTETEVHNYTLSRDQIQTFAQGLVKVLKVTSESCRYDDTLRALHCQISIEAEVQVSEGRELLRRLHESRQREQSTPTEISFAFNLLAFRPGPGVRLSASDPRTYSHLELPENGVLHSGDAFQVHFTPAQDAWVYVLNVDSQGRLFAMLPNPEAHTHHHLRAGQRYLLPGAGQYYQLDQHTGTETLYLIAARQPMPDIEYLLSARPEQAAGLLAAAVQTRGISRIQSGPPVRYVVTPDLSVEDIEERISGYGAVARVFRFQHR